jgi:hypothetical protein
LQEQIDYISKIISDLQDFARPLKTRIGECWPARIHTTTDHNSPSARKHQVVQECKSNIQVQGDSAF